MSVDFDYNKNNSWGNMGWLGSDEYYAFWGCIIAKERADLFQNKTILDIGAGNGRIWQEAIAQGLAFETIHLIDTALNVSPDLAKNPDIILHPEGLQSTQKLYGDVAMFKQSIHHIHDFMGSQMFDVIQAKTFVNLSMPANPDWPMSPEFEKKILPSCLDITDVFNNSNKKINNIFDISYLVEISRDDWCTMIKNRFTSTLHDCNDEFITQEITWAQENLPSQLNFSDRLECLIVES